MTTQSIGIDAQTDLLHNTENEYLELANNAQEHINSLNKKVTDQENKNIIEFEFLSNQISALQKIIENHSEKFSKLQNLYHESTQKNIEKIVQIKKSDKIIAELTQENKHLKRTVEKFRNGFQDVIAQDEKRIKIDK